MTTEVAVGPELDVLVAERVMGVDVCYHEAQSFLHPEWCFQHGRDFGDMHSTDIAAAWKVVERMRELGWWFRLDDLMEDGVPGWEAAFEKSGPAHLLDIDDREPDGVANGETAPEAICRAALEAINEAQTV